MATAFRESEVQCFYFYPQTQQLSFTIPLLTSLLVVDLHVIYNVLQIAISHERRLYCGRNDANLSTTERIFSQSKSQKSKITASQFHNSKLKSFKSQVTQKKKRREMYGNTSANV